MLTIKGYNKLDGRRITITYRIKEVKETRNFYDFYVVNELNGFSAVIGLRRTSRMKSETNNRDSYDFVWNGQYVPNSVTADWISDVDNMVKALKSVTDDKPW